MPVLWAFARHTDPPPLSRAHIQVSLILLRLMLTHTALQRALQVASCSQSPETGGYFLQCCWLGEPGFTERTHHVLTQSESCIPAPRGRHCSDGRPAGLCAQAGRQSGGGGGGCAPRSGGHHNHRPRQQVCGDPGTPLPGPPCDMLRRNPALVTQAMGGWTCKAVALTTGAMVTRGGGGLSHALLSPTQSQLPQLNRKH